MDEYWLTYLDNEGVRQSVAVDSPADARAARAIRVMLGGRDFALVRRSTGDPAESGVAVPLDD